MPKIKIISSVPIHKGWSCDEKYCVTAEDGKRYLLRVTPKSKNANRGDAFRLQEEVSALGVPMCQPIEFVEDDWYTCSIHSWIDGADAEEIIPELPDSRQYVLGLEAGRILKKIHFIPAPEGMQDWESRFNEKIDRKIQAYQECPMKFDGGDKMMEYVNENRQLLAGRPQTFQHGDYHIGNMMMKQGKIVIIDFDRYDFGDPWEEFNRIVFSAQKAPIFASGIVNGYFDDEVPIEFWRLLALYMCSNALGSLSWAISFGDREVRTMHDQAEDILAWYDNMQKSIPTWYLEG